MQLSSVQKAKAVLFLNFFVLFILIIFTPYFIEGGILFFGEAFVEGTFLAIEIFAMYFMFKHYDAILEKKENENLMLSLNLRKKERELLNVFQYMGKVNVQVSMIKSVFENMKTPSSKQELKNAYRELLRLVCSASGNKCAGLRIVNLKTGRTLGDFVENFSSDNSLCKNPTFGNRELIKHFENKTNEIEGFNIFYSKAENFSVKAFVFTFKAGENQEKAQADRELLEMVANQCEIFYLLYNFQLAKN